MQVKEYQECQQPPATSCRRCGAPSW